MSFSILRNTGRSYMGVFLDPSSFENRYGIGIDIEFPSKPSTMISVPMRTLIYAPYWITHYTEEELPYEVTIRFKEDRLINSGNQRVTRYMGDDVESISGEMIYDMHDINKVRWHVKNFKWGRPHGNFRTFEFDNAAYATEFKMRYA